MPRSISIVRRRVGYVDLQLPKRDGQTGFRFSAASNFDAAFTAFQVVPNHGFRSTSLKQDVRGNLGNQARGHVRFLFNPADYTAAVAAVRDDVPIFIRVEARNPDGSFEAPEAMHMLLPYTPGPNPPILLRGTVPSGADISASLEIQLPYLCNDWEIQNDGAADMFIAFDRGATTAGPEYRLQPASTVFRSFEQIYTTVSQLFLRGSGGSTTISAVFTGKNNPIGN